MLNNPDFKPHIYEGFKSESAKPHFWMSAQKWIKETGAIGIVSKSGRYGGGTFAHSDIAFKFGSSIEHSCKKSAPSQSRKPLAVSIKIQNHKQI